MIKEAPTLNQFNHLNLLFVSHLRAFLFALGEMVRAPLTSFLTVIVIGVATSLPAALYLFLQNFEGINHYWSGTLHISLYLKPSLTPLETNSILQELRGKSEIADVNYISPQEGLIEFEKATGLASSLNNLKENPLPGVVVLTPQRQYQSPEQLESLIDSIKLIPNVDTAQFDMTWIKRLYYLIQIAQRITYALAILFSFGVILIVGNTIRLITQNNRQEIAVLRLIGATSAFIRRPFLYRGILYGFLGGLVAWILVSLLLWWLATPFGVVAQSYNSQLGLKGFSPLSVFAILGICSLLGLIGAWFSVNKQLRAEETL